MVVQEPKGAIRYIMIRCVGQGGHGDVFEALDLVTKKSVAVKRSKPNHFHEGNWIDSKTTVKEGEILSKLDHPNIIKLLDTYVHDDKHHLVLELMETNFEKIMEDPTISLSSADCKSYMQMLLQGLAYLQENHISHGDLKCENILIGRDGKLKIADFGLAWCLKDGQAHYFEVDILECREIVQVLLVAESKLQSHEDMYEEFENCAVESLSKVFPGASEGFLELYEQIFLSEPERRITLQQALQHRYFTSEPLPTPAYLIPRKTFSAHEI